MSAINITTTTNAAPTIQLTQARDAYQLALATGFVGTLAEWLESLEGANGPAGPNSVTSATSSDGTADLSVATLAAPGGILVDDGGSNASGISATGLVFADRIFVDNAAEFAGGVYFNPNSTVTLATPLPITSGGTGATTDSAARTELGLGTGDEVTFRSVNVGLPTGATATSGLAWDASNHLAIWHNSTIRMIVISTGTTIGNGMAYAWSSGAKPTNSTRDLSLFRDAANTLAQRNGENPQAFRLYNTYTSSTNFERLNFRWDANVAKIGTEKGIDGGTARDLVLETGGTERVRVTSLGTIIKQGLLGINTGYLNGQRVQIATPNGIHCMVGQIGAVGCLFTDNGMSLGAASLPWPTAHITTATVTNLTASDSITGGDCILSGKLELNTNTKVSFGPQTSTNPMLVKRGDALLGCRTGTNVSDASFSCLNLTASGTVTANSLALTTPLPITSGGTGGNTASTARTALKVPGSDPTGIPGASPLSNIISITQAGHDTLVTNGTTDPTTLYVIA